MSPTARNQGCENFQDNVFPAMRTPKLEASELQALYGDYTCSPEEEQEQEDEQLTDEYTAGESVSEFTYLAGEAPQLYRPTADSHSRRQTCERSAHTHLRRQVLFSNEAYYSKLEELKTAHLKNIAELQRLHLNLTSGPKDRQLDEQTNSQQVGPRLHPDHADASQRGIASGVSVEECVSEQEDEPEWDTTHRSAHVEQARLTPPTAPPAQRKWCSFLKSSTSLGPANQQPRQVVKEDTRRRGSAVTITQPFQMTLREDERKLRRVKTRSEVELENERLRKELDELKECGRKFRATPAPASTHLAVCDVINMRNSQWQSAKEHAEPKVYHLRDKPRHMKDKPSPGHLQGRRSLQDNPSPGHLQGRRSLQDNPSPGHLQGRRSLQDNPSPGHHRRSVPPLPQAPFSFIERERKKKEKKLQEELNNLTPREERRVFKARPVPKSLYRRTSQDYLLYGAITLHSRAQEHKRNSPAPPGSLEDSLQEEELNEDEGREPTPPPRGWAGKKRGTEKVSEMERRRNGERERDWSYIHPLSRASFSRSQEALTACKSEYISV